MNQSKIEAFQASRDTIEARAEAVRAGKVPETYTEKLMASQNERVKKLTSEAGELVREDWRPDFSVERLVGEVADVNYSVSVMTAARGLPLSAPGQQRVELHRGLAQEDMDRILRDKSGRTRAFGAATMGLMAAECQADFSAVSFICAAADVLLMTDFILAGQGLTSEPVIEELIRRNQQGG